MKRAHEVLSVTQSLSALLAAGPARPLIVHANGRVDADEKLARMILEAAR